MKEGNKDQFKYPVKDGVIISAYIIEVEKGVIKVNCPGCQTTYEICRNELENGNKVCSMNNCGWRLLFKN